MDLGYRYSPWVANSLTRSGRSSRRLGNEIHPPFLKNPLFSKTPKNPPFLTPPPVRAKPRTQGGRLEKKVSFLEGVGTLFLRRLGVVVKEGGEGGVKKGGQKRVILY